MFEAISPPSGASAAVISRVVVVLPLVPVTRTTWRPAASRDNRSGARRRLMTPPMTEPSPLPARRETVAAAPPTVVATLARIGSRKGCWVLSSIVGPMLSVYRRPAGRVGPPRRAGAVNSPARLSTAGQNAGRARSVAGAWARAAADAAAAPGRAGSSAPAGPASGSRGATGRVPLAGVAAGGGT